MAGRDLRTAGLTKHYGGLVACQELDLEIRDGEFFSVVGPSGSGKTTLLMMLTGMLKPTSGEIFLGEKAITRTPPQARPTCLVFQNLALFPHRTVGQNIEFPLKMKGVKPEVRRKLAMGLLTQLHLPESYYSKNVTQCSGGERQRVALARSLAYDPDILFFDEPLSAIDYQLRKILQRELKDIHRETRKTFVYVTHSLEEAMVMSDRLGIMRGGQMIQVGTPSEIYGRPANKFVAEFMGEANVVPVVRREGLAAECLYSANLDSEVRCAKGRADCDQGYMVVRPEHMRLVNEAEQVDNSFTGLLSNEYVLGSRVQYHVDVGDLVFTVEMLADEDRHYALDQQVTVGWDCEDAWLVTE